MNTSKIKSIKKIKCNKIPVYDISVPKYNNFVLANGLVVHNCKPYQYLRSTINDKRLEMYEHKLLIQELTELERDLATGKVDHPSDGCFTGETEVCLVDGRSLSFLGLIDEYNQGKENYVYSINLDTKKIEPKKILKAWKTLENQPLVRITFDNNQSVECTLNHRFMLRNGEYIEAQDLIPGDSLMPLYTKYPDKSALTDYRMYYEPFEDKWRYEHRQFAKEVLDEKYLVHHKNCNKQDNSPTNLVWCSKSLHTQIHAEMQTGACSEEALIKKSQSIHNWHELNKDHKVISIEFIDKTADVYDIEVEDNHNFALAAGIFVHNSKDAADAVCGAIFNASSNAEQFAFDYGETSEQLLALNSDSYKTDREQLTLDLEEQLKLMNRGRRVHPSDYDEGTTDYTMYDDIIII